MSYAKFVELEQDGASFVLDGGFIDFDSGLKKGIGLHEHFEFFSVSLLSTIMLVDVRN
jgi:hypothetical protein